MSEQIELKPCPFCGSKDVAIINRYAECRNCHCQMHPDEWNTRPIEDALQRRLDIAVKALTEISNSTNEAYLTGGREMKRIASQAIAAWNEMNKVEVNDDKPE